MIINAQCFSTKYIHALTLTYFYIDLSYCFTSLWKNTIISESTKPPNYNEQICGYALTVANWNQPNKIYITATIDGRRDGDHTNDLDIIANVYHQPPTAQITVTPNSFTVTSIKVNYSIRKL